MRRVVSALVLSVGVSVGALGASPEPPICDFTGEVPQTFERNPDSPFSVEYRFVAAEPGKVLDLVGRRYVMVRVPFADLVSGELYALNFPTEVIGYPEYEKVFFYLWVTETGGSRPACSDVAIEGGVNPSHRIPVSVTSSVQGYGFNDELQARASYSVNAGLSFRTGTTHVQVGLSVESPGYADCYEGKPTIERAESARPALCAPRIAPGDYDMVDDTQIERLTDADGTLLQALDTLVDYVYVEKLE